MKDKLLKTVKKLNIFSTLCGYINNYIDKDIPAKKGKITGFRIKNKTIGQKVVGYFFTRFIEYKEDEKLYVKKKNKKN